MRTQNAEIHGVRLGDMAFASNPFEYYVDYGIQIKARSPATRTFLVQLAGAGTYVPSLRSTKGGGYGSEPASNSVGPERSRALRAHPRSPPRPGRQVEDCGSFGPSRGTY